jgi:hypothetical protein
VLVEEAVLGPSGETAARKTSANTNDVKKHIRMTEESSFFTIIIGTDYIFRTGNIILS